MTSPAVIVVTNDIPQIDAVRPPDIVVTALGATYLPGAGGGPAVRQVTAVGDFTFHHNLAYPPPVRFVDPTGLDVQAGIEYPTAGEVHVSFPTPFTGTILIG